MINAKAWIIAARLRTLFLALSSIGIGGVLAFHLQSFNPLLFALCMLTTLFLQILSNFANDYGDFVHGADTIDRKGPERMVQSGMITDKDMKKAMFIMGSLAFLCGVLLLYFAISEINWMFVGFLLLGILAIAAAIKYTAGANPYGYKGLGDIFVFLFFGPVAVLGTCFLQTHYLTLDSVLPSIAMGLFATGVLNVNNIRDIETDKVAGKKTIPVKIGKINAKIYHSVLIGSALTCALIYSVKNIEGWQQIWPLFAVPFFIFNIVMVWKRDGKQLDSMLKQLAISTLMFSILFSIGIILN
jgi:1,4-dihydroxy-2-naphthoate octaprenyltransferase